MSQEDDTSKGCSQPVYLETMNIPINCGKINIIFTLKNHKSIELAVFDNLMELHKPVLSGRQHPRRSFGSFPHPFTDLSLKVKD